MWMIISFQCKFTESLFFTRRTKKFASIGKQAFRKLLMLHRSETLNDLLVPPGNRLEALKGDLAGYHSIRINNQWRILFRWQEGAHDVEIVDYH
jgi:toxin HigB-1